MLSKKRNALNQELIQAELRQRDLLTVAEKTTQALQESNSFIADIRRKLEESNREVNLRVHEQMELIPSEIDKFTSQEHLNGECSYEMRRKLAKSGVIQRMAAKFHLQQYRTTRYGINESRWVGACVNFCIMHLEDLCAYSDEEVMAMLDGLIKAQEDGPDRAEHSKRENTHKDYICLFGGCEDCPKEW